MNGAGMIFQQWMLHTILLELSDAGLGWTMKAQVLTNTEPMFIMLRGRATVVQVKEAMVLRLHTALEYRVVGGSKVLDPRTEYANLKKWDQTAFYQWARDRYTTRIVPVDQEIDGDEIVNKEQPPLAFDEAF
jgi:hypothetical protein